LIHKVPFVLIKFNVDVFFELAPLKLERALGLNSKNGQEI
jgi:hypothetical protein